MVSPVVKEQLSKVSKYYENDCHKNFLFHCMSLLTAKVVKTSMFRLELALSF